MEDVGSTNLPNLPEMAHMALRPGDFTTGNRYDPVRQVKTLILLSGEVIR